MPTESKVVLLEFNELSPALMARFIAAGHLPNFARLRGEAEVFVTDAEEEPPNLEPWIQWVTVHTGLPFSEHRVFHLGDGHSLAVPRVWDVLSARGLRVGVCGSMNPRGDQPLNGFLLPDAWSAGCPPYPDSLLPYYRFIRQHVLEYTNERVPLRLRDYVEFVTYMGGHGLSAGTVATIARQLLAERFERGMWRRAVIQDRLQFDLFSWHYRKLAPHFATFFLNSTAHFQHMYWRNLEPELFLVKPTREEQAEHANAILFGYRQMDDLVGRFFNLVGDGATIVFCTALSQQPCLTYEDSGGKSFYRPRNFAAFLGFAGVTSPHRVEPVMSEQFHVKLEGEADAAQAERVLRELRVDGRPAMMVSRQGRSVFAGCGVFDRVRREACLEAPSGGRSVPFFDIFYQVEGLKSGMHHPDGMLWIRRPDRHHHVHERKLPLIAVAPMLLEMFSVPVPGFMRRSPHPTPARAQV